MQREVLACQRLYDCILFLYRYAVDVERQPC